MDNRISELQDEIEFLRDELNFEQVDSERMVLLSMINELKEEINELSKG